MIKVPCSLVSSPGGKCFFDDYYPFYVNVIFLERKKCFCGNSLLRQSVQGHKFAERPYIFQLFSNFICILSFP